jgi:hypothetical protein
MINGENRITDTNCFVGYGNICGLMSLIGEQGHQTWVKYDNYRDKNNYTIIIDGERIGDTDDPYTLLKDYIVKNLGDPYNFKIL